MSDPFTDPTTPESHFTVSLFAALVRLSGRLRTGTGADAYLGGYWSQIDGSPAGREPAGWRAALDVIEADGTTHLPLVALRRATGLGREDIELLLAAGLVEEDQRFGAVFAGLCDVPARRPTAGLLATLAGGEDPLGSLDRLERIGLLVADDPSLPAPDRQLAPAEPVWALVKGEAPGTGWARVQDPLDGARLILGDAPREALDRLPRLLAGDLVSTIVVRGPQSTGRRTFLRALAGRLGKRVLLVDAAAAGDSRWRRVAALAALAGALPVVVLEPGPGEAIALSSLGDRTAGVGVVLPTHGGLAGPLAERAVTVELTLPDRTARVAHWRAALPAADADVLADEYRMTAGHIRRTAALARAQAALHDRDEPAAADLRTAARLLHGRLMDTLCEHVAPVAGLAVVACEPPCRRELELLVARCRHREALAGSLNGMATAGSRGVRALFTGPSGTGKTLAARAVAGELGVDLYRLDLSLVVDKYVGETEKNLAAIFDRAEQADVALLLDEGDSLLTRRTAVSSANDRYANLETNFLLQRLERFTGVLIVTTNASDRIDGAFRRRMDVVIEFPAPEPATRHAIWTAHLPAAHAVEAAALQRCAALCALSGGQIRTAAEHATLLALEAQGPVIDAHVLAAIHREYRKAGQVCPLGGDG